MFVLCVGIVLLEVLLDEKGLALAGVRGVVICWSRVRRTSVNVVWREKNLTRG